MDLDAAKDHMEPESFSTRKDQKRDLTSRVPLDSRLERSHWAAHAALALPPAQKYSLARDMKTDVSYLFLRSLLASIVKRVGRTKMQT